MAEWKKVVVSGSSANLANVQVDSLSSGVVTGAGGNLTTTAINGAGNIVATTGASGLVHTGSFTGSFTGDGSGITGLTTDGSIVDGNGIADFTYDGSSNVVIKVDSGSLAGAGLGTNNSTLTVNVDDTGIEINSDTLRLKDDGVTAAKLDDVFTTGGGVAGTFGSTTAVPKLTIDGQGRITTASLETIATSFDIAADSGTSDTVNGGETLTFAGGTGVSTTVSNNNIAINIASGIISSSTQIDALFNLDGIVSASAFTSPSQGTVRATINGVQTDVDTGLQTGDSPTFVGITATGNALIQGDLTVQGTTTTLSTTNTTIKDKFILLNSGSANPDEGGLVIDEGSGTGHAFIYDAGDGRFGINKSVSSTATTANSEAYVSLVVDQDNAAHDITDTEYHKRGNIKVDSSNDIFIYV
tara:strand:- start:1528 stop:2769 length:1242 start_codon:yes stop_codon:yes gene_type:complete